MPSGARTGVRSVSVVVPALDEAACIGALVRGVLSSLDARGLAGELVVVDDGSRDGTADAARAAAGDDGRVRVIRHASNRGYGAALRTGVRAARGDHLLLTDADLQFELGDLDRLLPYAPAYDLVVGFRSPRADPAWRRVAGRAWSAAADTLVGSGVRDVDCAFKLVRREVFDVVALRSDGAAVSPELLARARRAGFRVKEVPVRHRPRPAGEATGGRLSVAGRAAWEMVSLRIALGAAPG